MTIGALVHQLYELVASKQHTLDDRVPEDILQDKHETVAGYIAGKYGIGGADGQETVKAVQGIAKEDTQTKKDIDKLYYRLCDVPTVAGKVSH